MNIINEYGNHIFEVVTRCEETREKIIFQTIHDFATTVYQTEINKQELIDAILLIRKAKEEDIPFKDPKMKLAWKAGYDFGVYATERKMGVCRND